MNKYLKFFLIGFLFFLLILVRAFASNLFYDPFIEYYKNDYLYQAIPKIDSVKLFTSLLFRYLLNSIISIGIIFLLFKNQFIKFTIQFYIIAFIILASLLLWLFTIEFPNQMILFYIRRFLIHPIFVLLLIPAFYYQKQNA